MSANRGKTCRVAPCSAAFFSPVTLLLGMHVACWRHPAADAATVPMSWSASAATCCCGLMRGGRSRRLIISGDNGAPGTTHPDVAAQHAPARAPVVRSGAELEPALADAIAAVRPLIVLPRKLASDMAKVLPRHRRRPARLFYWLDTRNMLILLDELARRLWKSTRHVQRCTSATHNALPGVGRIDRHLEFCYRDVRWRAALFFITIPIAILPQVYAITPWPARRSKRVVVRSTMRCACSNCVGALAAAGGLPGSRRAASTSSHLDLLTNAGEVRA